MKVLSGNGHKKCGLQRRGIEWISELSYNKWIGHIQFFQPWDMVWKQHSDGLRAENRRTPFYEELKLCFSCSGSLRFNHWIVLLLAFLFKKLFHAPDIVLFYSRKNRFSRHNYAWIQDPPAFIRTKQYYTIFDSKSSYQYLTVSVKKKKKELWKDLDRKGRRYMFF